MGNQVSSATIIGIDAHPVQVETQIIGSLRRFALVGLPDGVLREAKDRVRCALENCGFAFPHGEVIVNLAPAALPKRGSGFDLAIALSVLAASQEIPPEFIDSTMAYAELHLDGSLKSVGGELAVVTQAKKLGLEQVFLSEAAAQAACSVPGIDVFAVPHLSELVAHIRGLKALTPSRLSNAQLPKVEHSGPSLQDVVGQQQAKRALEIAASGGHNVLMVGPPGSGKSMLAERLPSLLPSLSLQESLEVATIHSVSQFRSAPEVLNTFRPPYRAPHHSTSVAGLVGGGTIPSPGEITLAHRGVLFLDEIAELRRDALEALRMPLESKVITLSRSSFNVQFPADCIIIAAMNPCPCGKYCHAKRECRCSEPQRRRYFERLSGPIRDRFDLQLWVPAVPIEELQARNSDDGLVDRQARVSLARTAQEHRGCRNAALQGDLLREACILDEASNALIKKATERYALTARGYTRVLRVARTIADLEDSEQITSAHVAEALSFRCTLPGA